MRLYLVSQLKKKNISLPCSVNCPRQLMIKEKFFFLNNISFPHFQTHPVSLGIAAMHPTVNIGGRSPIIFP